MEGAWGSEGGKIRQIIAVFPPRVLSVPCQSDIYGDKELIKSKIYRCVTKFAK